MGGNLLLTHIRLSTIFDTLFVCICVHFFSLLCFCKNVNAIKIIIIKKSLSLVLDRLWVAGLTLKRSKCNFGLSSVTYLGHIFSSTGMLPDPKITDAIDNWPTPSKIKEVQQFLDIASYYRRYIPQFNTVATPRTSCWKRELPSCGMCTVNSHLKHLNNAAVLAYPDKEFQLFTDASHTGLGAVLQQSNKISAYKSRTLTRSEKNYGTIQKERLALAYAMKEFQHISFTDILLYLQTTSLYNSYNHRKWKESYAGGLWQFKTLTSP